MRTWALALIASVFLFSCESDDEESKAVLDSFGYDYMPLDSGLSNIYQVDSILYNDFTGRVDTVRFQLREKIVSSYINNAGNRSFVIEVAQRTNDTARWVVKKQIAKTKTSKRVEKLENNLLTVPLVFPVLKGVDWDGNALNAMEEKRYSYAQLDVPFSVNGLDFDSTLLVNQGSEDNFISKESAEERYAKNIGLLIRKDIDLETDFSSGDTVRGYISSLRLISSSN